MTKHADRDGSEPRAPFSRVLREGGSPAPGDVGRWERALDAMEPFGEAPAGPPLHEQTDRDADNVPSDRVRTYAEALMAANFIANRHRTSEVRKAYRRKARAVMAVADREQAALREEVAVLRQAHAGACCEFCDASTLAQLNRADKAEATIARVEALTAEQVYAAWWALEDGSSIGPSRQMADRVLALIRATVLGPEPTEDGA